MRPYWPGTITSWEINATLPSGLNFGTSNGTIWGTPTVLWTTNFLHDLGEQLWRITSATVNITINDVAPGPSNTRRKQHFTNNEVSAAPRSPILQALLPRGPSMRLYQVVFTIGQPMEQFGERRPNCGRTIGIHGLGQQQRWLKCRLSQHHGG